jgi:hypothetical protein
MMLFILALAKVTDKPGQCVTPKAGQRWQPGMAGKRYLSGNDSIVSLVNSYCQNYSFL